MTAIITGASSGLGAEFVKAVSALMPEIDDFWLVARRKDRLDKLLENLGKPGHAVSCDISDKSGWDVLKAELETKKPDVKLLINCAGAGKMGDIADSDAETQTKMVALNVAGLTAVTTLVLPYMASGAKIINVSSISSFCPNARLTVYSATKAYVSFFSRGLGLELKDKGITVTAVCPGPMETEFLGLAGIKSKTFDRLPRTKPEFAAFGAVKAALHGKSVYTPRFFFQFYRVVAKILPQSLMIYLART